MGRPPKLPRKKEVKKAVKVEVVKTKEVPTAKALEVKLVRPDRVEALKAKGYRIVSEKADAREALGIRVRTSEMVLMVK